MSNVLIVYFSRTGTTRRVAQDLAADTGWDVEEIHELRDRRGALGYLRAVVDTFFHRASPIAPIDRNLDEYELVVVGTPNWARVSAPIRTFLDEYREDVRSLAFFVTYGGTGSDKVLDEMARIAVATPVATLALTEGEVKRGEHHDELAAFIEGIRVHLGRIAARRATPAASTDAPPEPRALR